MNQKRDTEKQKKGKGATYGGVYFLGAVLVLYLVLFVLQPKNVANSLIASGDMLLKILPAVALVIVFMGFLNYLVQPATVSKYVGKGSGVRGWFIAISTGILSHGPIYAWYPLLRELRNRGMKGGLIAVFLYTRAIKIPLLPVMVYYFGAPYVATLAGYLIVASIVQGALMEIPKGGAPQDA